MNKTLQVVLTALALAGTFCAINNGRKTAADVNNPNSVKAVLYADGTDPMPACRNTRLSTGRQLTIFPS